MAEAIVTNSVLKNKRVGMCVLPLLEEGQVLMLLCLDSTWGRGRGRAVGDVILAVHLGLYICVLYATWYGF